MTTTDVHPSPALVPIADLDHTHLTRWVALPWEPWTPPDPTDTDPWATLAPTMHVTYTPHSSEPAYRHHGLLVGWLEQTARRLTQGFGPVVELTLVSHRDPYARARVSYPLTPLAHQWEHSIASTRRAHVHDTCTHCRRPVHLYVADAKAHRTEWRHVLPGTSPRTTTRDAERSCAVAMDHLPNLGPWTEPQRHPLAPASTAYPERTTR